MPEQAQPQGPTGQVGQSGGGAQGANEEQKRGKELRKRRRNPAVHGVVQRLKEMEKGTKAPF
jgi:hypothetical protein